jgi:hypothetical protein
LGRQNAKENQPRRPVAVGNITTNFMLCQISGVLNNCTCKTISSGFAGFDDSKFYSDHYELDLYWGLGAGLGMLPLVITVPVCLYLLRSMRRLWRADEQRTPDNDLELESSTDWLV